MNCSGVVMGWDIGGAHLKAALGIDGRIEKTFCVATPVWTGTDVISEAMDAICNQCPRVDQHRITMTAELVDIFADREQGVLTLIELAETVLAGRSVKFLSAEGLLYAATEARQHAAQIASANWVAAARLAADHYGSGVLVDIGSTTTDLTGFESNALIQSGFSDLQRSRARTLIYQGVLRTPVCAWVQEVEFEGHVQGLAAEFFANAADVYRVLEWLPASVDLAETCDGRGKSWSESRDRIARMLLTDARLHSREQWLAVCTAMADLQRDRIVEAILVIAAATQLGMQYRELPMLDAQASDSLPAAALALWETSVVDQD